MFNIGSSLQNGKLLALNMQLYKHYKERDRKEVVRRMKALLKEKGIGYNVDEKTLKNICLGNKVQMMSFDFFLLAMKIEPQDILKPDPLKEFLKYREDEARRIKKLRRQEW
jgi:hypothetical protein